MMRRLLVALLALALTVAPVAAQTITSYPPTTANTITPFSDSSNKIATTQFVQGRAALGNSSTPFSGVTGGTYSFATLGSGAVVVFTASGGVLNGVITIGAAGSGYTVGDVLSPMGGNTDAYTRVTGVSGGGVTSVQILYGGTGYNTGGSLQLSPAQTFPKVFSASGTLTSNVTVIIPNGTFLLGSQERTVFNNTTGAFTTTLCVSNGSNACTGTTLLVPQGTANSTPISWFTDGSTGVWQTNNALGAGALAAANNLSDVASASTSRTNLGLGTAATQNTGTSGATVPLLNGVNTWSAAQTFNSTITPSQTNGIVGTTTNNNANAGSVGEFVSSQVLQGSSVALSTGVAANVTSISLTAGDWDVWGSVFTNPAGTTTQTALFGSISTTSATFPTIPGTGAYLDLPFSVSAGTVVGGPVGVTRISVSGTTTTFLVISSSFAVSTNGGFGYIAARRVR